MLLRDPSSRVGHTDSDLLISCPPKGKALPSGHKSVPVCQHYLVNIGAQGWPPWSLCLPVMCLAAMHGA